jgi:hypothetical protein
MFPFLGNQTVARMLSGAVRATQQFMPGSDLTSWDPLFKDDYAPAIVNQLAEENNALKFLESETPDDTWQGRKKVQPVKIGRNWSVGSIGAGAALPQAGRSAYKDFEIPMRDTYGRVGFERYVIEQSRNKKGSWQQVIPSEMDGLTEDLSFARNRMAWGYGSGILALVNGAVAAGATSVTVDAPGNVAGSVMGNRYLFGDTTSGMMVAFLNASSFAVEHVAFVSAVAAAGTSITIDTAAPGGGISDNALIVLAQTGAQHSRNKEPEGILAGADDGSYVDTYHNLSRTTYPILKSYVTTGVGALSLDAIQQWIDAMSIRTGKNIDLFACEHAVRRAYLVLLEADRRYTGADLMRPDGGTKAAKKPTGRKITYGDIPIMEDRDAPYRMFFGLTKESWIRYVMNEGQFADDDGSVLKWVSGFDQYTAFFYILDNWHCQRPNLNFRAEGIDVTQIAVHAF